jgi:hypothetical protein
MVDKAQVDAMEVGQDFSQLLVDSIPPSEVWIPFRGKKWGPFKVKSLGWTKKNRILAASTQYAQDGSTLFNWDKYYKEVLREILVPPPGFALEDIFMTKLSSDFGKELEKICPQPFDTERLIDKAKKELGSSGEQQDSPQA